MNRVAIFGEAVIQEQEEGMFHMPKIRDLVSIDAYILWGALEVRRQEYGVFHYTKRGLKTILNVGYTRLDQAVEELERKRFIFVDRSHRPFAYHTGLPEELVNEFLE